MFISHRFILYLSVIILLLNCIFFDVRVLAQENDLSVNSISLFDQCFEKKYFCKESSFKEVNNGVLFKLSSHVDWNTILKKGFKPGIIKTSIFRKIESKGQLDDIPTKIVNNRNFYLEISKENLFSLLADGKACVQILIRNAAEKRPDEPVVVIFKISGITPDRSWAFLVKKTVKNFTADTIEWVEIEVVEPSINIGGMAIDETVIFVKQGWFVVTEPGAAIKIGLYDFDLNNISSVAGKFAFNIGLNDKPDFGGLGSNRNAFRHALWQAMIANQISFEVAEKAGNAHEAIHKDDLVKNTSYSKLTDVDRAVDLRNNAIGRELGRLHPGVDAKNLALVLVEYFHEKGLWTIENQNDGKFIPKITVLNESDYKTSKMFLNVLNEFGL